MKKGLVTKNNTLSWYTLAHIFVLKAKRQLQKTLTSMGGEMNAVLFPGQRVSKRPLNEEE